MSRNISWINEIKNNTNQDFVIWCHDTDNEGEYRDFASNKHIGKNDGGQQVIIKAGAHLAVGGCGISDGGDKDNKPKARVICAKSALKYSHGDPGAGLRLNRVMAEGDMDKIVYRDHDSGKQIAEFTFPRGEEQNIILRIENDGIFLDIKETVISTEWKAYLVGRKIKSTLTDLLPDLAALALDAAKAALAAV